MSHFTPVVAVHVAAALLALALGALVFLRRKGTATHGWMGRAWAGLMLVTAISTFWITGDDGKYSWIHGLSVFVTLAIPLAVFYAIRGNIARHRGLMTGLYVGALIVAGGFSLSPDRLLGKTLLGLVSHAEGADLRVDVQGVPAAGGTVRAAVFNRAEDFPRGKVIAANFADTAGPTASILFTDLAPGEYAVAAYHDENGNGRLDTNLMGQPIEAYGFSRDASGAMGPPRFADAAVKVDAAGLAIKINLR
jgi:uncharacterized protein (DUF2141 family)/uncharacterized membrane protein